MPPGRLAISYSRFSDPKQGKGDSENRQEQLFRDFCTRHDLTPLSEIFADRGRSGYKDEHRKKGRLGQLIAMAKEKRFEHGTVIVVEAWDRLGRLRPDKQTELVADLLKTGVQIGVCRLNDVFTEDDLGTHKWTTLAVFIQLAYQESKQKADRVADSWRRRRERARVDGSLITGLLPAWLERVKGEVRLVPERAAAVRRVFRLAADGYGQTRIVKALTEEGVRPFGDAIISEGRSRSQFSGRWTKPYVRLLLNDRRALGEFQPCAADDKGEFRPDGPPIRDYFPPAITEEEFLLARAGQEQRRNNRTPREVRHVNVFRGLLRHARDGEGFTLDNRGTRKNPQLILINGSGDAGRERCWTFPYPVFEEAVLSLLREVDPEDVMPRAEEEASRADVLRAKLQNVRVDIAEFKAELKEKFSKGLTSVLRDKEAEEEAVAAELQEELARAVRPAESAWRDMPGLVELVKSGGDDARLKLRTLLRRMVEEMWLLLNRRGSYTIAALQVYFIGGTRRNYLILNQSAGFRRPGGWSARSFASVAGEQDFDLRKKADVKALERALSALPLDFDRESD